MKGRRALLLVFDGLGVGEPPDAAAYGDGGSDTLGHLLARFPDLEIPTLASLGLASLSPLARRVGAGRGASGGSGSAAPPAVRARVGAAGKMAEVNPGKDSTTGHWEMAGIRLDRPFPTYPEGFPPEVISAFEAAIGRGTLGNVPASGTEIIQRLGDEHVRTGRPIVYTSADSVFQVAAHEDVVPVPDLYRMCEAARGVLAGEHAVGRVIARPFTGTSGRYRRIGGRRDYSLPPPGPTLLDRAHAAGLEVLAIGKIEDLFAGRGISRSVHTDSNRQGFDALERALAEVDAGLIAANFVDFDMLWGHRNDAEGYARGLEEADRRVAIVLERLGPGDLLVLTSDHGNDPTTPGTDHSREFVPVLAAGPSFRNGVDLGIRRTFADAGETIAAHLGLPPGGLGESFLAALAGREATR